MIFVLKYTLGRNTDRTLSAVLSGLIVAAGVTLSALAPAAALADGRAALAEAAQLYRPGGNTLLMIWGTVQPKTRAWRLLARHSPDGGTSWEPVTVIAEGAPPASSSAEVEHKVILLPRCKVLVMQSRYHATLNTLAIGTLESSDCGKTWDGAFRPVLTIDGEETGVAGPLYASLYPQPGQRSPHEVSFLGHVHVPGDSDAVYLLRSLDGGTSWQVAKLADIGPW